MEQEKINMQNYPRVEIDFNPEIKPMRKFKDKTKINIRYNLIYPFAFAHIYWNPQISEVLYEIEEPILTPDESAVLEQIKTAMREMVNFNVIVEKSREALLEYIDRMF